MQIAFGIDEDTVQHSTPLKQKQRCNSLCGVSTSVPFETVHVHVHPKVIAKKSSPKNLSAYLTDSLPTANQQVTDRLRKKKIEIVGVHTKTLPESILFFPFFFVF